MAPPAEKLAQSLELLKSLQEEGKVAIRTKDLPRVHRERLKKSGFLQEVMKGWYVPTRPDEPSGESTSWYASFWAFCSAYLNDRFGADWCLSPEQSLGLHAANRTVPTQLTVRARKASGNITKLLHGTSLMDVPATMPPAADIVVVDGMRAYSVPAALIACSPAYFTHNKTDARVVLATLKGTTDILGRLLDGGHTVVAGRLAGAFRSIGRDRAADDIMKAMRAAGYEPREHNPFEEQAPVTFAIREVSPYVNRIRLLWDKMRGPAAEQLPASPGRPNDLDAYLGRVEETYVTDAYHSLSIEGYRVNRDLIERVRSGNWNPDANEQDRAQRDAMAARGYWQAFQAVKQSLRRVLSGENPGTVADEDHGTWYREMFAPSVTAGILRPGDLAGYRNGQVYIRRSMHVPPNHDAVYDAMPAFFELLKQEADPAARVVLGHFMFVYIHPYMDGNGRIGRFLMNTMLAAGGYPWTVIPVDRRADYMSALEQASVHEDIRPFAAFIGDLVRQALRGKQAAAAPK